MTDPAKMTPGEVRDAIVTWAAAPEAAKAEAARVSWRAYLVSVGVAALVAATLSSGLTWTFLNAWSSGWEVTHASGRHETCVRVDGGWLDPPRYACTETG